MSAWDHAMLYDSFRFLIIHSTIVNHCLDAKCKDSFHCSHCSIDMLGGFNALASSEIVQGEEFNTMTLFLNVLSAFEIQTYAPWRIVQI